MQTQTSLKRTALAKANGASLTVDLAARFIKNSSQKVKKNFAYNVSIKSDDTAYLPVQEWILRTTGTRNHRSLLARTVTTYAPVNDLDDDGETQTLHFLRDDSRDMLIRIEGHRILCTVEKPEQNYNNKGAMLPHTITFTAWTSDARDSILRKIKELVIEKKKRPVPKLWMLDQWGSWRQRSDLPPRDLGSVYLNGTLTEDLSEDLGRFLSNEGRYTRFGIPWHRGYLLHGSPGSGKSSLARALATEHKLDLWYVPLGDVTRDSNLLSLLSQIHPRSMVLLEDADVFGATHEREATKGELSLSGLLNALDGVASPHGTIFVLTTNSPDVLDSALTRPGRIDVKVEVGLPDSITATNMFQHFYPGRTEKVNPNGRSSAALSEIFKRNMDSPETALKEIRKKTDAS